MAWQDFYRGSHVRTRFAAKGPMYSSAYGHRGQDIAGWAAGTNIPSWVAGRVVLKGWSEGLGWIITVRRADGLRASFCHGLEEPALEIGASVALGQTVLRVGSTGTLTTGPHLHTTASWTGDHPGTAAVLDPLPFILAAIGGTTAGNGVEEIDMPLTDAEIDRIVDKVWNYGIGNVGNDGKLAAQFRVRAANVELDRLTAFLLASNPDHPLGSNWPLKMALANVPIGDGSGDAKKDVPLWAVLSVLAQNGGADPKAIASELLAPLTEQILAGITVPDGASVEQVQQAVRTGVADGLKSLTLVAKG